MEKTVKNIENVVISVQKLTQIHSTGVENIRQIHLFMPNKPNFPNFSPENADYAEKQTQFKPNTNPIKANSGLISRVAKPIKAKTNPIFERLIMNVFAWINSCNIIYCDLLAKTYHPIRVPISKIINYSCYFRPGVAIVRWIC